MTARSGSMPITKLSKSSFSVTARSSGSSYRRWSLLILRTQQLLLARRSDKIFDSSFTTSRNLAQVRSEPFSELWFTSSFPAKVADQNKDYYVSQTTTSPEGPGSGKDHKKPDERTLKLGKTLRILSPLLPNILTTPLPQDILSPSISLHLFPSTHPHLPIVKGRVPFRAALWTAPVAWGSVPIVGNVKLEIVSEKIIRTGFVSAPLLSDEEKDGMGEEKLIVRWRTGRKNHGDQSNVIGTGSSPTSMSSAADGGGINRGLSTMLGGNQPIFKSTSNEPFSGLFIFSFDAEGRIASQTIEHADENQGCDKTSKVVTLADWLLGRARWGRAEEGMLPGFAMKGTECRALSAPSSRFDRRFDWRGKREHY